MRLFPSKKPLIPPLSNAQVIVALINTPPPQPQMTPVPILQLPNFIQQYSDQLPLLSYIIEHIHHINCSQLQSCLQIVQSTHQHNLQIVSNKLMQSKEINEQLCHQVTILHQTVINNKQTFNHLRSLLLRHKRILCLVRKKQHLQQYQQALSLWNRGNLSKILSIKPQSIQHYANIEQILSTLDHNLHLYCSQPNLVQVLIHRHRLILSRIHHNMTHSIANYQSSQHYARLYQQCIASKKQDLLHYDHLLNTIRRDITAMTTEENDFTRLIQYISHYHQVTSFHINTQHSAVVLSLREPMQEFIFNRVILLLYRKVFKYDRQTVEYVGRCRQFVKECQEWLGVYRQDNALNNALEGKIRDINDGGQENRNYVREAILQDMYGKSREYRDYQQIIREIQRQFKGVENSSLGQQLEQLLQFARSSMRDASHSTTKQLILIIYKEYTICKYFPSKQNNTLQYFQLIIYSILKMCSVQNKASKLLSQFLMSGSAKFDFQPPPSKGQCVQWQRIGSMLDQLYGVVVFLKLQQCAMGEVVRQCVQHSLEPYLSAQYGRLLQTICPLICSLKWEIKKFSSETTAMGKEYKGRVAEFVRGRAFVGRNEWVHSAVEAQQNKHFFATLVEAYTKIDRINDNGRQLLRLDAIELSRLTKGKDATHHHAFDQYMGCMSERNIDRLYARIKEVRYHEKHWKTNIIWLYENMSQREKKEYEKTIIVYCE